MDDFGMDTLIRVITWLIVILTLISVGLTAWLIVVLT